MATVVRIDIDKGGPTQMVERAVRALSPPIVTYAVRDAAKVFQRAIASNAPKRSGRLSRSFGLTELGPYAYESTSDLVYAPVQEYGAVIKPRFARFLRFIVAGKLVFAKKVKIPARPYVAPAFEEAADPAFYAFADYIDARL